MVDLKIILNIARNPNLIIILDQKTDHPMIRKYSNNPFSDQISKLSSL